MRWYAARVSVATLSIFFLVTCANAAFMTGDVIWLRDAPGGPGGLFDVTRPGDSNVLFQSFCAHVYEDLDFNTNYKAIVSDATDPGDFPVGPQAAWLYTQFVKKNQEALPGFNFNRTTPAWNGSSQANNQARALQLGIWRGMGFSQNEIEFNTGWDDDYIDDLYDDYLDDWIANFDASGWGPANYIGHVKILNLYGRDQNGQYTRNVQDQLYVPEPGTALLLGTLLVGMALGRRSIRSRSEAGLLILTEIQQI